MSFLACIYIYENYVLFIFYFVKKKKRVLSNELNGILLCAYTLYLFPAVGRRWKTPRSPLLSTVAPSRPSILYNLQRGVWVLFGVQIKMLIAFDGRCQCWVYIYLFSSRFNSIIGRRGRRGIVEQRRARWSRWSGSFGGPRVKNLINHKNPGSELDYWLPSELNGNGLRIKSYFTN